MKRSLALTTVAVLVLSGLLWVADAWARVPSGGSSGSRGSRASGADAHPEAVVSRHASCVLRPGIGAGTPPQPRLKGEAHPQRVLSKRAESSIMEFR